MKSLNENIGLSGTGGMSHFDGVAVFDPEIDSAVISAKKQLTDSQNELDDLRTNQLPYWEIQRANEIEADKQRVIKSNTRANGDWNNAVIDPFLRDVTEPAWQLRASKIKDIKARIKDLQDNVIPVLQKKYQDAKTTAIEANNKIVESQIKLLAEKAKTDPVALEQITKLNEQKIVGEQALAKQKIIADAAKNKSSNIKIYVIIGAVALGLTVIASIWIWLKSRKAV